MVQSPKMKGLRTSLAAASVIVAILIVVVTTSVYAQRTTDAAAPLQSQSSLSVPEGFVFAAGGDLIGPSSGFSVETTPGILRIAELFRRADLGFANQEGAILIRPHSAVRRQRRTAVALPSICLRSQRI